MKKTTPPSYRWCPAEHRENSKMSFEIEACYWRLLNDCCENNGLPSTMLELAEICRYSPVKDFENSVWRKLKEFFYLDPAGKYQNHELDIQREKAERLSGFQSIRAKGKKKPAASRRETIGKQPLKDSDIVFGPTKITGIRRETAGNPSESEKNSYVKPVIPNLPPDNQRLPDGQPTAETINHASGPIQPTASPRVPGGTPPAKDSDIVFGPTQITNSPREAHGKPAADLEKSPKFQRLEKIPGIPGELEEKIDNQDLCFDVLAAWQDFASLYGEDKLVDNLEAQEAFFKVVRNEAGNNRVRRALDNYQERLKAGNWGPPNFVFWFQKWQIWEDPEKI